jgi:hypothetical protein
MKKFLAASLGAGAIALVLGSITTFAVGLWPGLPIEGGASYCAGYSGFNTGNTTPGTFVTSQCQNTVPAGVASPTGTEYVPADLYGLAQTTNSQGLPSTNGIAASALGAFGPQSIITVDGATVIANNTPNFEVNVSLTTGHTITLPATPQPWQLQRVSIIVAPTNSVSVLANSNQTLSPSTTTGTSAGYYAFLWNPVTLTWYRVQ